MIEKLSTLIRRLGFGSSSPKESIHVLLVEENLQVAPVVRQALETYSRANFVVHWVVSTERCLHVLNENSFDLMLLDYDLPGEDGIAFLLRLNRDADIPPVIMLTPQGHESIGTEAMRCGACDYLPRGSISSEIFARAIHQSLEAKRLRDELARLAIRDQLTGLYSRLYLAESLEKEAQRVQRYKRDLSCLIIGLDDFKLFNEVHGQEAGNAALRQVAALILDSVRGADVVARYVAGRYGDDEFCVLLIETPLDGAMTAAESLRFAIAAQPVVVGGQSMPITASIGVCAVSPQDKLEPDTVLGRAYAALQEAKAAGKNRVSAHLPSDAGDEGEARDRAAATKGAGDGVP